MIRASQLQPQTRFSSTEFRSAGHLSAGGEWNAFFQVVGKDLPNPGLHVHACRHLQM